MVTCFFMSSMTEKKDFAYFPADKYYEIEEFGEID